MPKNLKQKKKVRSIHRRLRNFPQERFQHGFDRLSPQMPAPVEVHKTPQETRFLEASMHVSHGNAPSGDFGSPTTYPTQVTEEVDDKSIELGFGQEIHNQYVNESGPSRASYLQVPQNSSSLAAERGVQVGDMARYTIPDIHIRATHTPESMSSESMSWAYQDPLETSYSSPTQMGISQHPILDHVSSDPFTISGPQSTTPGSSSPIPQCVSEYPVQHNYMDDPLNSWSVPTVTNSSPFDPRAMEHWCAGYEYSDLGNGSWSNRNPN